MKREKEIPRIYKQSSSCDFEINGTYAHPEYYDSNFRKLEYDVLKENGLIDDIVAKVPDFKQSDLQQNEYKLYHKGYALWTQEC